MSTVAVISLISIVVVIILGSIFKVNYGILALVAAFICGCFLADMTPSDVIGLWGTKLFIQMFSITFFYSFSANNGTLQLLAEKVVYATRKIPWSIPIVLFFVGAFCAGIGPGSIAAYMILIPVYMKISRQCQMKLPLAAIVAAHGVLAGSWTIISVNGITIAGILESCGYSANEAAVLVNILWKNMAIYNIGLFIIAYIIFKGWKCVVPNVNRPDPFNKKQRITILLMVLLLASVIIFQLLQIIANNSIITWIADKADISMLALLFGCIASLCKLGDEKEIFLSIPWKTIIMVCGMGVLISVASEIGVMEAISNFVSNSFTTQIIPFVLCVIAGIMSLFSSTMGVVVPTLFPIAISIALTGDGNISLFLSAIVMGSVSTGDSPFSLCGGLIQAGTADEDKNRIFYTLIIIAFAALIWALMLILLGVIS